tara:strand:+ start:554 stop:1375 length:822 start_codon:yes stop_codon:yes gene_type:complete
MEKIHYCIGLPRTCSTVLMRLLSQNPKIFTSNTCPLPYFVDGCHTKVISQREVLAMDLDLYNKAYVNFLYGGIKSWFETLTDKPVVISKSKMWAAFFPHTFAFDATSRYLVLVRDLRDIFCSYETQTWKRPTLNEGYQKVFEERVKDMTDPDASYKLGPWLLRIPHIMERARKHPRNFMFIRQEDFTAYPKEHLKDIYKFIEEKNFEHDLDNLPDAPYYEHDAVYQQPISHKVRKKLEDIQPRWPQILTKEESNYFIDKFKWYYELFYPEELK